MAVMATEEPQTLPVVQKSTESAPSEEKSNDDTSIHPVNGHSEDKPKADEKPTVNGKAEPAESTVDDSLNQKAFAANGTLPDQSTEAPPSSTDVEMADVNGTSAVKNSPTSTSEVAKGDTAGSSTSDKPRVPEESAVEDPVPENVGESMDVDTPAAQPDEEPKVDRENGAQDKPEANDVTEPTSSQDAASQPSAGLAKLDIKATQSDVPAAEVDTPMADQPMSAAKVSREREEDAAEERAPKRAKTEEDASGPTSDSLVVADPLSSAPGPSESMDQAPDDQVITPFQNRQIRQILAGVKKTKNGLNFRQSVEKLWPGLWEDYRTKIENPVDISLFEAKLREDKYANYGALKADIQLLYQNSLAFNGESNAITMAAGMVRDTIFMRLPEISKLEEPAKPEKGKAHPTRHTEPRAATQPRRQSQSQPHPQAASPKPRRASPAQATQSAPSSSAPAFAIPPNGIPQIRRDSTREDSDRPKRPIHPPKNRDLDYAAANRKKLEPEQRFFEVVLDEVKKGKHYALNQWFLTPVDPVALNIPTYFSVVKKPMDLATMTQKNYEGEYKNVKDIEKDMRLIVHNAELFNGPSHDVTMLAKRLEELFKGELAKRDSWMKRHHPPEQPSTTNASAPSPERSAHDSEEESEADGDDDEGNEAFRTLQTRLDEEQDKLNTLLGSKKPDLTMIEIQQQMVSMLQRKLVEERTKLHSGEKKPKSKKKATKSKPKSGGGGSVATSKKAAGNSTTGKKASGNSGHKKAVPKGRPVGALEKAVIAEGINELDGTTLTRAVEIIKRDTGQNVSAQTCNPSHSFAFAFML
ncbi:Bromodomain-containing protein [Annulohypoxylon truncatum]|uniref:Bromodomain-containing protein n=1 Tax=Annulohypoxylon truncatum TaxID=327061 RepID=UPI002008AAD3|nr:Bromodomain-containing protein [Annulohypoxylon truncatum]KAI1210766.1 Bromodomain-containing protein [Annulohypoxylon truncatum]